MTFGLITEGVSEHNIIKYLLERFFRDEDPYFSSFVPKIVDGKQIDDGGWTKVLEACGSEDIETYLIENDYLIVQIDTDMSQTSPFNVSHTFTDEDGKVVEKPTDQLHKDVMDVLQSRIPLEIWGTFQDKIIFAICIHTIECWLLPAVYSDENRTAIKNCLNRLNRGIKQKLNLRPITQKNSVQSRKTYATVLSHYKKKKDILEASRFNFGFQRFIDALKQIEDRKTK